MGSLFCQFIVRLFYCLTPALYEKHREVQRTFYYQLLKFNLINPWQTEEVIVSLTYLNLVQ